MANEPTTIDIDEVEDGTVDVVLYREDGCIVFLANFNPANGAISACLLDGTQRICTASRDIKEGT